ncbi:MAG: GIY-YIG nuclease family protein [Patescibacteria group bacterium]
MFYLYALLSGQNKDVYIGYCEDLRKRFSEHNSGFVKATKGFRPWKLVYYEAYVAKFDATRREAQLKKNHRAKEDLKNQIKYSLKAT